MAKVEIDIPDDLLRRIDGAAERAGVTRDDLLRQIAEAEANRSEAVFRAEMEEMLGPPRPMGGDSAQIIREMRDQRLPPFNPRDPDDD